MTLQEAICIVKESTEIDWTQNFVEEGLFDSLDIMTLVDMLEKNFHCKIKRLDIIPENFISLKTIEDMVIRNGGSF